MAGGWIGLAAPIAAVVIALITTVFNLYDASRRAKQERQLQELERRNQILEKTGIASNKYKSCKAILFECTSINEQVRTVRRSLKLERLTDAMVVDFANGIVSGLETIRVLIASDQIAHSQDLHDQFNTETVTSVRRIVAEIGKTAQVTDEGLDLISHEISEFKRSVSVEFETTVFE